MTGNRSAAAAAVVLILLGTFSPASGDADPVLDFCVPEISGDLNKLASPPCRDPSNLTADDFVFSGARSRSVAAFSPSLGFSGLSVTAALFPALNTLGMSFTRADIDAGGGVNPPHYHPRATETALVVSGEVYAGFVDSGGRVFARVVRKGEVAVFPRGMIHFQMNAGDAPATVFGFFNSQNPGAVRIPATVFGSGIKGGLLERAFGLSEEELEKMERRFAG